MVRPINIYDDPYDEDTAGLEGLIEWWRGSEAAEMRRVAGYGGAGSQGVPAGPEAGVRNEEWVGALKKLEGKKAAGGAA